MFVNKHYEMDPQFEDLLPDGTYLKEGMIVLVESPFLRADLSRIEEEHEGHRARETNRWATVSHVRIYDRFVYDNQGAPVREVDPLVTFIATYADGTKRKRSYSSEHAWIVKIDSLPKPPEEDPHTTVVDSKMFTS